MSHPRQTLRVLGGITPQFCHKNNHFFAKNRPFDSKISHGGQFFLRVSEGDLKARFGAHMSRPRQILRVLGGVKHPQICTKTTIFWPKIGRVTLKFHMKVNSFHLSQRALVGKIWGPYVPSPANMEGPGGCKTPPNCTKTTVFWPKIDCLTKISYGGQCFSIVSEGTCR